MKDVSCKINEIPSNIIFDRITVSVGARDGFTQPIFYKRFGTLTCSLDKMQ